MRRRRTARSSGGGGTDDPGTWRHGEIVAELCFWLKQFARDNPGWSVAVGDPGTKLTTEPPTLRGPDAALLSVARRPNGRGAAGWVEGAPELVFEVQGDSQSPTELAEKALEYLAAGAGMAVVLDGDRRGVIVYTAPNHVAVIGADGFLDGGHVVPGFRVRVGDLSPPASSDSRGAPHVRLAIKNARSSSGIWSPRKRSSMARRSSARACTGRSGPAA
jgi:Uma2 family endonuclease